MRFKWIFFTLCLGGLSQSALALLHGEIAYGMRQFQTSDVTDFLSIKRNTDVLSVGVQVDPFPLIPASVGLSYTSSDFNVSGTDTSSRGHISQSTLTEIGFDVKAWVPFIPFLTPYGRLRYIASSKFRLHYENTAENIDANVTGFLMGAGVEFSFGIPLVSVFGEAQQSFEKSDAKIRGKKITFNSNRFLIGLKVGL